jgi:hypothetical protein
LTARCLERGRSDGSERRVIAALLVNIMEE